MEEQKGILTLVASYKIVECRSNQLLEQISKAVLIDDSSYGQRNVD